MSNDECDEQTHEHANEPITHQILTEKILPKNKYRKVIHKLKRKNVSVVFNVSNLVLTESMEKLLNRGFKFAILPLKLDLTQVLVDYKRFERSMIWHEFWFGTPQGENTYKPPLFKSKKNNLPKNHRSPHGLCVCVYFQLILLIHAILVCWSTTIAVVGRPPDLVQKPLSYS